MLQVVKSQKNACESRKQTSTTHLQNKITQIPPSLSNRFLSSSGASRFISALTQPNLGHFIRTFGFLVHFLFTVRESVTSLWCWFCCSPEFRIFFVSFELHKNMVWKKEQDWDWINVSPKMLKFGLLLKMYCPLLIKLLNPNLHHNHIYSVFGSFPICTPNSSKVHEKNTDLNFYSYFMWMTRKYECHYHRGLLTCWHCQQLWTFFSHYIYRKPSWGLVASTSNLWSPIRLLLRARNWEQVIVSWPLMASA